jgi:hypothetical protein
MTAKISSYSDLDKIVADFSTLSIDSGIQRFNQMAALPAPTTTNDQLAKKSLDKKVNQFVSTKLPSFTKEQVIQTLKNSLQLKYNLSSNADETRYTGKILELLRNKAISDYDSLDTILKCVEAHKWTHDAEFLQELLGAFSPIKKDLSDTQIFNIFRKLPSLKEGLDDDAINQFMRSMVIHLPEKNSNDFYSRYQIIRLLESIGARSSTQLKTRLLTYIEKAIQEGQYGKIQPLLSADSFSCLKECGSLGSVLDQVQVEKSNLEACFNEAQKDMAAYVKVLPDICSSLVKKCKQNKEPLPTDALKATAQFLDTVQNLDQKLSPSSWVSLLHFSAESQNRIPTLAEKALKVLVNKFDQLNKDQIIEALHGVAKLGLNQGSGTDFCKLAIGYLNSNKVTPTFDDLIQSLWALAILQLPFGTNIASLATKLLQFAAGMVKQGNKLSHILATQLYQICCWIDLKAPNIPGPQKAQVKDCKAYIEKSLKPFERPDSSILHKQISEIIKRHGVDGVIIQDEHLIVPYFVDIAILQPKQAAIDVQGPTHKLSDGTIPPKDTFKKAVLTNKSWPVLYIDYERWEMCKNEKEKVLYLQELFQQHGLSGIIKL